MDNSEIDFVLPWVDGSDPEWRTAYELYSSQEEKVFNKNGARFRDWGLLRFWFRGVEEYAPWVRKIHFVTCGHYPSWLDLNHSKINFVKHSDYIPSQYLPTFSSHVIENNVHRIEGLADRFVLFNDDVFLSAPVSQDHFFKNDLPRDVAARSFISIGEYGHIGLNNVNLINRHLDFWTSFKRNKWKWFNYQYGIHCLRNIYFLPFRDFNGIKQLHLANSYLKSTFLKVWELCSDELEETCNRKFRSINDVNQYLFKYWQIASGSFYPKRYNYGLYCKADDIQSIENALTLKNREQICIKDDAWADISGIEDKLQELFIKIFPQKSSFELY